MISEKIQSLYDAQEYIAEVAEALLSEAEVHPATAFGLDERCGNIHKGEDFLAVPLGADRRLQYYGGFEYIEPEYRQQIGNFVFYSVDADRVAEAFDTLNGIPHPEGDEYED